jgi:N-acetylglucosaminyldiphosphoundecaprenol N-acetyl-beta-D-mannosaminyltransferase
MFIFNTEISTLTKKQTLEKIQEFLTDGKQRYIVTPNPEFLLEAERDQEFASILNHADLAVPDGFGLVCAGLAMGKIIHKFPGVELVELMLDQLIINNEKLIMKIGIINWEDGLSNAEEIQKFLTNRYSKLEFMVIDIPREFSPLLLQGACLAGRQGVGGGGFNPDILFVALGSPWQEKWIYHNLKNLPSVKIAMGVGGSFDFITQKIKRAPKIFRVLGLEWIWRLIKQPWRRKRIFNAAIVFPFKFVWWWMKWLVRTHHPTLPTGQAGSSPTFGSGRR